jgi:hypothetical protein
MREFYIYSGQASREVLKWLIRCYLTNFWSKTTLNECKRLFSVDQEDPALERIIPQELSKHRDIDKVRKLLGAYNLDPQASGSGAGKNWPTGQRLAKSKFPDIEERFQTEISLSDHFHISHSGGGGIGCGSGPVFSSGLHMINQKLPQNRRASITSSVFLPDVVGEPAIAVPNTCSTIGFHSRCCDGVFLFDISYASKWVEHNGPLLPPENCRDQYWVIDYAAAEIQLMLASLNERVHLRASKNFEGSDLASFCRGSLGTSCSLIVPCYAEYPTSVLDDLDIKVIVDDLLMRRALAQYSIDEPIQRLALFCIFPARYATETTEKQASQKSLIKEIMPSVTDPWPFFRYYSRDLYDRIKILGLVVNPYIPRLFEMLDEFKSIYEKWNKTDSLNTEDLLKYKNGYESYSSFLKNVYDNPVVSSSPNVGFDF